MVKEYELVWYNISILEVHLMENNAMIRLEHFFLVDTKIKKEIYDIYPPNINGYLDNDSMIEYTDRVSDSLIYIFNEMKCVTSDLFGTNSVLYQKVCQLENVTLSAFIRCGTNAGELRTFYRNFISDMKPELVEAVKDECVGYTFYNFIDRSIELSTTVNEILHLLHSYVLNNENILQSIPEIGKKENSFSNTITLRGKDVASFNSIFQQFPSDLNVGQTDMVALNEKKLLLMVRDRGHALTVEITINGDIARLEYFIPKLCNTQMINNLPGINPVKDENVGATGVFEVPTYELANSLYGFISKVPTDADMVINRSM